jgi:tight adherence protein B
MTGLWVFLLAGAACLALRRRRPRPREPEQARQVRRHRRRGDGAELAWQLPVVVRQLASLLRSGRTPAAMWQDIGRVYDAGAAGPPPAGTLAEVLGPRIRAAGRAAELGLSVADTLRQDNGEAGSAAPPGFDQVWTDLAACWEASELTGAPLAVLLENYADHLQQELDAAAARRTALAGPRATSVLLTWLPLLGLGLGMLMGVDPLGMLLGTPSGWMVLAAGVGLLVLGRVWSRRLVAHAAHGQDAQ